MLKGIELYLSPVEQQVIVTALGNLEWKKTKFKNLDCLIAKIKGQINNSEMWNKDCYNKIYNTR